MVEPVLALLRRETSTAHEAIERQLDMQSVIQNLESYRGVLAAFFGFYEPIEELMALPADREKSGWLRSDLVALGVEPDELKGLPRCERLPRMESEAAIFGGGYVLEGATLGGRQISVWLEKSPVPANARTFFHAYGEETASRWKEFCASLQAFQAGGGDADAVVLAARETFAALADWMACRGGAR